MNSEKKVEPTTLEVASDSNLSELQKFSISDEVKSEEAQVAFQISQNNQNLLRLCTRSFEVCPTGQHNLSPCTHLVNC